MALARKKHVEIFLILKVFAFFLLDVTDVCEKKKIPKGLMKTNRSFYRKMFFLIV